MNKDQNIVEKINEIIDSIRIYVNQDGGDLEFVKYENGDVYIKILGACVGCAFVDLTYQDGIETILKEEIPQIKKLILIEGDN